MLKLILERWQQRDGRTDHLWSLWLDGKRVAMAPKPLATAAAAESEARAICVGKLGREPDRTEHL